MFPQPLHTYSGLQFRASEVTDPEHRDASISVPCFLMPQKFVSASWRFSQKLENVVEFKNDIHGLLSDACTLDTCCVTNDLLRRSLAS